MYGFNSAVSGLTTSKKSLYVTNHNLTNMNTEGYSRQIGRQRATSPLDLPGIGFLGTGTEIYNIERVRNSYVDFKYWNESAPKGEWEVKKTTLTGIEKLFGEPSNSSFRKHIDEFFDSLNELSKNPSDYSYREPVKESGIAFTKHINEVSMKLEDLRNETDFSIETKVKQVNNIADQISSLNKQIYSLEIDGKSANDLRDQRELLIDNLSSIVDIKVHESKEGKCRVSVSGTSLVEHDYTNEMIYKPTNEDDLSSPKELKWRNGDKINLKSGEIKGLVDLVEGNGEDGDYRGVPYYEKKLNEYAKGFADKINDQHSQGYRLDGTLGTDFFYYDEKNPASTIYLHEDILKDIGNIAVAGESGGVEDARNMLEIIQLRENKDFFTEGMSKGTPDDFIKSMLSNVAVDCKQAQRMDKTQKVIMKNIVRRRQSESGISLDEEIGNLVRFQHAYVSAAKMITTFDAILDVTINRLGLVGR